MHLHIGMYTITKSVKEGKVIWQVLTLTVCCHSYIKIVVWESPADGDKCTMFQLQ